MKNELLIKDNYEDFKKNTILSVTELDILVRYLNNETIVKISNDLFISTSSVSRHIKNIKIKYNNYKLFKQGKQRILEQRINKAIEYIKNNYEFYYGDELYDSYQKIINILQGE